MQQSYDTKLMDATHDAVVAFELNTQNNTYSNTADSVRRDITAAINTFTTSLASGLNIPGANPEYIMPYIPAILITLYDGYYIYSPSENIYITDINQDGSNNVKTGYTHILKPYVYYSAKYVSGSNYVVVNYSLDNYIAIYGVVNGEVISNSGYLGTEYLSYINDSEQLSENIVYRTFNTSGSGSEYNYHKIDNCKYIYYNGKKTYNINGQWYYLNGLDIVKAEANIDKDYSAINYKESATKFNNWLTSDNIGRTVVNIVTPQNARDANDQPYKEFAADSTKILLTNPEDAASAFNQHKREVIKLSIQDNLNNAIAIYNQNSGAMGTSASFAMPILSEDDWEKIITNVNFVTFMQGLPVGNKIYNNYSIVTSTNNKQYVSPDSIYLVDKSSGEYHTYKHALEVANTLGELIGYKSADFERVKYEGINSEGEDAYLYYYRRPEYGDYSCVVEAFVAEEATLPNSNKVKNAYYTALARERYNLDKVTKLLINYNN